MVDRILITGAHSTGKTTLVQDLYRAILKEQIKVESEATLPHIADRCGSFTFYDGVRTVPESMDEWRETMKAFEAVLREARVEWREMGEGTRGRRERVERVLRWVREMEEEDEKKE
ncbi:hypothetical protein JCM8547_007234 [Rhodosporidiobolus lusitaniae]